MRIIYSMIFRSIIHAGFISSDNAFRFLDEFNRLIECNETWQKVFIIESVQIGCERHVILLARSSSGVSFSWEHIEHFLQYASFNTTRISSRYLPDMLLSSSQSADQSRQIHPSVHYCRLYQPPLVSVQSCSAYSPSRSPSTYAQKKYGNSDLTGCCRVLST